MFKVGQKVICVDASPPRTAAAQMPLRLIEGEIYTVRSIHTEPNISGYGVRLAEILNPSIVWRDGDEKEWSYQPDRFRPVVSSDADSGLVAELVK